jgi:hypothetical protein
LLRRQALYPAELRARRTFYSARRPVSKGRVLNWPWQLRHSCIRMMRAIVQLY